MSESNRAFIRDTARYSPIAVIGGGLIGVAIGGGAWNPRGIAHGALIGLICFAGAIAADIISAAGSPRGPTPGGAGRSSTSSPARCAGRSVCSSACR